ncbi:MAG: 4-(cytidine 5'-diphospho)-2-C-methyl-D-erythritol kinase, partial [Bacteroidaceae bacterium]|nr:4-(cytidine 5'-diphospho)-2-C-methyl-D-erythritol kinase [Bacteroidaceae bacterium]
MILYPNAKLNLGLHIVERRPDGYHNLETVFYPFPLCDVLEINAQEGGQPCTLDINGQKLDCSPTDNLIIKAMNLLKAEGYDIPPTNISLQKRIPSGAGLGGGSADAAFMLTGLNELYHLDIPTEQLEAYATRLGADCAIFIQNKPVYAEGIGNLFTPVSLSLAGYYLVVIKPDIFISTGKAFSQIHPHRPDLNLKEIICRPIETWRETMANDFETSVFPQFPRLAELKAL